jgi:hypothetical protein
MCSYASNALHQINDQLFHQNHEYFKNFHSCYFICHVTHGSCECNLYAFGGKITNSFKLTLAVALRRVRHSIGIHRNLPFRQSKHSYHIFTELCTHTTCNTQPALFTNVALHCSCCCHRVSLSRC